MAPEVIACEQQLDYDYDSRCDIWSLGNTENFNLYPKNKVYWFFSQTLYPLFFIIYFFAVIMYRK